MTELIGEKEFQRFSDEADTFDYSDELFRAWGIDPEALKEIATYVTGMAIESIKEIRDPLQGIFTAFLVGFELGYKARLEIEQKEKANEHR